MVDHKDSLVMKEGCTGPIKFLPNIFTPKTLTR